MVNSKNSSDNDLLTGTTNGYQQFSSPPAIHNNIHPGVNLPTLQQESIADNRLFFGMCEEIGRAAVELIQKVKEEEEQKREMIRRHEQVVVKRLREDLQAREGSKNVEAVFNNLPPLPHIHCPDDNEILTRINKVMRGAIEGFMQKVQDEKEQKKIKNLLRRVYEEQQTEEESNGYEEDTLRFNIRCVHCKSQSAEVVWLPCTHLYLCFSCDRSFKVCPTCNSPLMHKVGMRNLPEDDS